MTNRLHSAVVFMVAVAAFIWAPDVSVADWIKNPQPIAHGIFVPQGYDAAKKYPLVVCLHGNTFQGNDYRPLGDGNAQLFAGAKVQEKNPCFVLVPQCPGGSWVNSHWSAGSYSVDKVPISQPLGQVVAIMTNLMKEYSIDKDRLYVVGASMGGQASWDLLGRYPEMFAGAVISCGCGDPSKASLLKNVGIWASHGTDDNVINPASEREIMANLEKAGSKVLRLTDEDPKEAPKARHIYSEYKIGHNVWNKTGGSEAAMIPWLFSQSRTEEKKAK